MAAGGHFCARVPRRPIAAPGFMRTNILRAMANIDVRELLKRDMFASRARQCDDHFEKSRACPASPYGISDVYVILDTYLAAQRNPRRGEFMFRFGGGQQSGKDKIGLRDVVRTLIQLEVEEFCTGIPPIDTPGEDTSAGGLTFLANVAAEDPRDGDPITSSASQLAHCPRVTMYLSNLGMQAHSDHRGRYHHFEFEASGPASITSSNVLNGRMTLTPVEGKYTLTEPHQELHDLRVRFFTPDEELELPPAVIDGVQVYAILVGGNLRLTLVGPTTENDGRTILNFVNLITAGDRVFFENVNLDPATFPTATTATAISRFLNQEGGHLVGTSGLTAPGTPSALPATSNTRFEADQTVDMAVALGVAAVAGNEQVIPQLAGSLPIRMYIAKNRIRIPLRMRCIVPRLTNYIAP